MNEFNEVHNHEIYIFAPSMTKSRSPLSYLRSTKFLSAIRGPKYTRDILPWNSTHLKRQVYMEIFRPSNIYSIHKYPVLILNDGQDSEALQIKYTVEKLWQRKEVEPAIIVAIHAGDRMQEYGVSAETDFSGRGGKAGMYSDFIVQELFPYLKSHFPLDVDNVCIAGFSLGALSALDMAWNHSDIFKKIGAFSGSFWWRNLDSSDNFFDEKIHRIMHNQIKDAQSKPGLKFWFQTGTKDENSDRNKNGVIDSIDDTLDLIAELTKKGYRPLHDIVYFEMKGGEHNQHTWAQAMPQFLKWAFGKQI